MAEAAHVLVLSPGVAPRAVPLSAEVTAVGSGPEAAICLSEPDVEPLHAELKRTAAGHEVVRRGQSLLLNGKRVRHSQLAHGDLIQLGRSALSFRLGPPPARAEVAPGADADTCSRLFALARRLSAGDQVDDVAAQVLADVLAITGAETGAFVWLDESGAATPARTLAQRGEAKPAFVTLSQTAVARVIDERKPLVWLDTELDPTLKEAQSLRAARVRSLMCAPVLAADRVAGVLYVSTSGPSGLGPTALDLLAVYASLLSHLLADATGRRAALAQAQAARAELEATRSRRLVGSSDVMRALLRDAAKVAHSQVPVLLSGETGTGKELLARDIHDKSPRAKGPFVALNCGAIPTELLESTVFGHVKGAFTGASAANEGLLRAAHSGTLFLDEIAELAPLHQAKLLRVLEGREVTPVGANEAVPVDFRLLSASHRPLQGAPGFREDLYFRVAGVVLRLPPLRERGHDVLELAEEFLRRQRAALGRPQLRLSAPAQQRLQSWRWPGNVRELEGAISRACALSEGDDLPAEALGLPDAESDGAVRPLVQVRDELLKRYVRQVVEQLGGNRTAAAAALGVTPRTIFKYLEEV